MNEPDAVFSSVSGTPAQRVWDGVIGRVRYGTELTLALVELDPGSVIPEHSHHNEQVGLLIDGAVTFRVGSEERRLEPGASWCIPPHTPHEVRVDVGGAIVIEAFAPPRHDWHGLPLAPPTAPRWPT